MLYYIYEKTPISKDIGDIILLFPGNFDIILSSYLETFS